MRHVYQRLSVWLGFFLFSSLLIANAVILRDKIAIQVNDSRWTEHTQRVLLELGEVQSALADAETAQRGYLYTGDAKYLAPFSAGNQVDSHLQRLQQLVEDNLEQSLLLPRLRELSRDKMQELTSTISLYQAGKSSEARAVVLSDRGKTLMDDIRAIVSQMRDRETTLYAERAREAVASQRVTRFSIYGVTFLSLAALFALCAWVLKQISERERHAAELRQREEWWRVTLTSIGDGVVATDADARVTFMNPVAEHLTGFSLREAVGRPVTDILPLYNEATMETVGNPIHHVLASGNVAGLANHTVLKRRDGTLVPIEDSAAPIRDGSDRLIGIVLVFRDAGKERAAARAQSEAAEALRASEEQLRIAASAGDLGLWTWKVGGEELIATDKCKAIFGLEPGETFAYSTAIGLMHPEDREKTEAAIMKSLKQRCPYKAEYRVIWRDGSVHWISAAGRGSYDENGEPLTLSGACAEITERRNAEEAVRLSHRLSSASSVAHELAHHINNPLTIVTQSLYLLAEQKTNGALKSDSSAQEATERIARIARQLLGLYSAQASPSVVRITDLLDDAIDAYSSGFPPGAVQITKRYDGGGDVFTASSDIRQLCVNLVANAFENSKCGGKIGVRVSHCHHPRSGEPGVRLLISDNGPGIPEEHRQKLFNVFFSTKDVKGSGLGLWTSRSIVNKYGGSIRCKTSTRPGRSGTSFMVFLPTRTRSERHLGRPAGIGA